MELARVVGSLWATQKHASFQGGKLLVIQPVDAGRKASGSALVAMDTVGAGPGEIVFYTTFYESTIPWRRLHPGLDLTPVGASIVGIVDRIDAEGSSRPEERRP